MADNTAQNGTATIAADDIGSGVLAQRVKIVVGADGTGNDIDSTHPIPTCVRDTNRVYKHLYATGAASGTTGTETIIQLAAGGFTGAAPAAAANSYTPTSGKRFRVTSITVASRGNATATAQVTTHTFRMNTAGAITTSSNSQLQLRTATPATALAWDRVTINFEGEGPDILGDGTLTFGMTANAVFVTNAPTWDVLITGYEYTP
jgi:hypothetical protein